MIPKDCGDCTVCCHLLAVEDVGKAAGEPCRHLIRHDRLLTIGRKGEFRAAGCEVHADKPPACAAFRCEWLKGNVGLGEMVDRPDKCGVMFTRQRPDFILPRVLTAEPAWPGAERMPAGATLIQACAQGELVLIKGKGGSHELLGPKPLMKLAAAALTDRPVFFQKTSGDF